MLFASIILVDGAYIAWFVYGAVKHEMSWISMASTQMYTEVAKAVIVSAGIVSSVLPSAIESSKIPHTLTRPLMVYLAIAIVFSVLLIMILTRATETAIGRELRRRAASKEPTDPHLSLQGKLNWMEFILAQICGAIALGAFMLGILYLGRIGWGL
jgi:protein-S-isoprenylcysteine O-methyltransferase Ste14